MHGAELDPFFVFFSLNNSINENAGRVDLVGVELPHIDKLLDLGDADLATSRDHRIKVPRRLSINEVAGFVALPRFHDRQLRSDSGLKHIFGVVEHFGFLALSQFGAEAGACVESRDPRATRTQPLRERPLGNKLEFKFTRQDLTLKLLVLANIRGHHLFHLTCGQQNSHSETIDASVVADNGQALHAAVVQGRDQIFRNAAQSEPARSDRHVVVKQAVKRGGGVRINFAHVDEI